MNSPLRSYLVIGGVLSVGYIVWKILSQTDDFLDRAKTQKIIEEIKHQILIATINFSFGVKNALENTLN